MDTLRIVRFNNYKALTVYNLMDGDKIALQRDTLAIKPAERNQQFSSTNRRYGGSVLGNETHDNGSLEATWYIKDDTSDLALKRLDGFLTQMEKFAQYERFIEWRPEGATRPMYYKIMAPGIFEPRYRWIQFTTQRVIEVASGFQIAPLAYGDWMNVDDNWRDGTYNTTRLEDYSQPLGAELVWDAARLGWQRTTGPNNQLVLSERGYSYIDNMVTTEMNVGATSTTGQAGGVLSYVDANNFLYGNLGNGNIIIGKRQGGTYTSLATAAFTATANTTYWTKFRREGSVLYLDLVSSDPDGMTDTPLASARYTLTAAEQAIFTGGKSGWVIMGTNGWSDTWRVRRNQIEPFSYRGLLGHEMIRTQGSIPGNAPADAEALVDSSQTAATASWGLLAWAQSTRWPIEMVANGHFEDATLGTSGWATTSVAGLNAASATSITRITSQAKAGAASAQIVNPATLNAGVNYKLPSFRFRAGRTYSATAWVRAASATTQVQLVLGQSAGNSATGSSVALSTTWQKISVEWTCNADTNLAYLAVRQAAATATTHELDAVAVWEGPLTDETKVSATGLAGGYDPYPGLALIKGEDYHRGYLTSSGWAATNEVLASGNTEVAHTVTSVASPRYLTYQIDPYTLAQNGPDAFSGGDIDLEVWARIKTSGRTQNLKITPWMADTYTTTKFYTKEFGPFGKLPTMPRPNTIGTYYYRVQRLGTFTVPIPAESLPMYLVLQFDWLAGSLDQIAVDWIAVVPSRQRAAAPSGKAETGVGYYSRGSTVTKKYKSDLQGFMSSAPNADNRRTFFPSTGIGGSVIELPPGNSLDLLQAMSQRQPDDPTPLYSTQDTRDYATGLRLNVRPRWFITRGE